MRVAHIITRMIIGGAQENTLLTAAGQAEEFGDEVIVVTGPGAGPEGSLLDWALERGLEVSTKKGRKSDPLKPSREGSRLHESTVLAFTLLFKKV